MVPLVLLTLVIGIISWFIYNAWRQKQRYPPGPLILPVVGTIKSMLEMMSEKKIWVRFTELQEKYGDVFTVFYINQPTVVLGTIEAVREALVTKQSDFDGRPESHFNEYFSNGYKDIIFGQATPEWKRLRKITHAALRKFASGECLEKYVHQSFEMVTLELDKVADTKKKFNPKHSIDMAIYNSIAAMVFSKIFEHNDPIFQNLIHQLDDMNDCFGEGLLADFIPICKYIPTKGLNRFHESIDAMIRMVKEVYEDHERSFDEEEEPTDIVGLILQTVKTMEKAEGKEASARLTEEHYQMAIYDIFSAGTDTSRYTLLWAVLYMTAFPDCQKKLQMEVDTGVGPDSLVGERHRSKLPYCKAFLYEVMRMRPVVPFVVPHSTNCDTSVGGHKIPAGTQIIPNVWALHMNKEKWGDPEAFRPERFLDSNGQMVPQISSWMPFSAGSRVCLGETLSKAELHMFLATFVQTYEFVAPIGTLMDLNPKPGQLMVPSDFELLIRRRI